MIFIRLTIQFKYNRLSATNEQNNSFPSPENFLLLDY